MGNEQMENKSKYSIIVPPYNEWLNIALLVYLILKQLPNVDFEIIAVDDGNPDGIQEIVKQLQSVYGEDQILPRPRPKKLGLGTAYIHGLKPASGSFVVIVDVDLLNFIKKQMVTSADIVTGTRYVKGGGVHGWNLMRKLTRRGATSLHKHYCRLVNLVWKMSMARVSKKDTSSRWRSLFVRLGNITTLLRFQLHLLIEYLGVQSWEDLK